MVIATSVVVAAALCVFVLWQVRLALLVIYLSLLVAAGLLRPIRAVESFWRRHGRNLPRWAAALAVYLVVLLSLAAVVVLTAAPFTEQAREVWQRLPEQFNDAQDLLRRYGVLARRVTIQEAVQQVPRSDAIGSINTVLVAGSTVAALVAAGISILIFSYYVLVDGEGTALYLLRFVPAARRPAALHVAREVVFKVGRWVEGTLLVGALMGVAATVALGLLGVPSFYVVAVLAGIGEAIPMVGPMLAGAVAVLVSLTVSPGTALTVGVFFAVLHEIEVNILVPKIMGQRIGISAIAVMAGLLLGWELMGVLGAVLAIPTVAIATVLAEEILPHDARVRMNVTLATPEPTSAESQAAANVEHVTAAVQR